MNVEERKTINYKAIGHKIRQIREGAGLSQEELGKLSGGLSAASISLYENGERRMSLETLSLVAGVLNIGFEELISDYAEDVPSIRLALRADKELKSNEKAQKQILEFIEFVKKKRKQNG